MPGMTKTALFRTGGEPFPIAENIEKRPQAYACGLCRRYLSSRAVASQVLSAHVSLTTVFEMGTGGPSP